MAHTFGLLARWLAHWQNSFRKILTPTSLEVNYWTEREGVFKGKIVFEAMYPEAEPKFHERGGIKL